MDTVRKEHGQWHAVVMSAGDLNDKERACYDRYNSFLLEVEKTNLTKSFKLVLLEALMELEGFKDKCLLKDLSKQSYQVLRRRRALLSDLPTAYLDVEHLSDAQLPAWSKYWRENPVNAWIGGNTSAGDAFFKSEGEQFYFRDKILAEDYDVFTSMVQELIDYRFAQYEQRLATKVSSVPIAPTMNDNELQEIPYFSDLKIACGHFRKSPHETKNIQLKALPMNYGQLDPAKHFIANASGDSMDGGAAPIKDKNLLLLELLPIVEVDKYNGEIVAAKCQTPTGVDQFLLRKLAKNSQGRPQLIAQNSKYPPIDVVEGFDIFAKFKQIVDPLDLCLHSTFKREEIPPLFGLVFNAGNWQSGHVTDKDHPDQFLLVTLNKQGKAQEHKYHDYFINADKFHWQSQNSADPTSKKGSGIINHQANGSKVHLFVRKNKLENNKGAPFLYCGTVQYESHVGKNPMSVTWSLDHPLSVRLQQLFM